VIFFIVVNELTNFFALHFNRNIFISSSSFDLIHSNVWGFSLVSTKKRSRYYVFLINDHTHYCWGYLMKHHPEFFEIYKAFQALVKTTFCCYQIF